MEHLLTRELLLTWCRKALYVKDMLWTCTLSIMFGLTRGAPRQSFFSFGEENGCRARKILFLYYTMG